MYPLQGMGSNGTGMMGGAGGAGGSAGGLSPQMLALLLSAQGGGTSGLPNMPGNPLMPGAGGTPGSPMSNFIGAHPALGGVVPGAGGGGAIGGPMGGAPMPAPGPAGSSTGAAAPSGAASLGNLMSNPQQLMALLTALKGGQSGVPQTPQQYAGSPQAPVWPGAGGAQAGPNAANEPGMFQKILQMFGGGSNPGGFTGGASGY